MRVAARLCIVVLAAAAGCGVEQLPPKPNSLEADISFNDAGDAVTIVNKNRETWHRLYVTFIDKYQRRYYYLDDERYVKPDESVVIPLREFADAEGNPLTGDKSLHWRWRLETGSLIWRFQTATDFPTKP